MGASYPDLNRCTFMFTDDRRCRNPIETPGAAFCVYHREKKEKEARPKMPRTATRPRSAAAQAFFQWFCHHPLDTATSIHQTLNQVVILLAAGSLSPLEANMYLRACRQLLKTYKDVGSEFKHPWLSEHKPVGEKFLAEVRESLVPAILADDRAAAAAAAAVSAANPAPPPEPSLEEACAAALAADPERRLAVEGYFAAPAVSLSNPPAVSLPNPPAVSLPNPPPVQPPPTHPASSPVEDPEPSRREPRRTMRSRSAPSASPRPLTVGAHIAEYLTANLRPQPAVSPDAKGANPHAESSPRASP